jgi:hypothetical protein
MNQQGYRDLPDHLWLESPVNAWRGCSEEQLAELAALLAPYDVVGVQTFHGLTFGRCALQE